MPVEKYNPARSKSYKFGESSKRGSNDTHSPHNSSPDSAYISFYGHFSSCLISSYLIFVFFLKLHKGFGE